MTSTLAPPAPIVTIADLLDRLGGIEPGRVRFNPIPGTATEKDVLLIESQENRLFELVDGALVEKVMGYRESVLAVVLATALQTFVAARKRGLVSGPDGMMRLFPGLVRIPDVAFVSRERLPNGIPKDPIPDLVPDLAVEILSESNTPREMARKRGEYFDAGVRLVWFVDPDSRTVVVYTGPEQSRVLTEDQTLDGDPVLPGFSLVLKTLFAELDAV